MRFLLTSVAICAVTACTESPTTEPTLDGGADATMDTGVDLGPMCGNGRVEPGESCDDGNDVDTDACSNACRNAAFCGDGEMNQASEVCDDGNNASGDACSPGCDSLEVCGNGIRDLAIGEICDDTPGCATDCLSLTTCGDDEISAGETCDDANMTPWDGCAADCRTEGNFVFRSLQIADETIGCDFSGDGAIDNAFAIGLGGSIGLLNNQLDTGIAAGYLLLGMSVLGSSDVEFADATPVATAWLNLIDADSDAENNLEGEGVMLVDETRSLNADFSPSTVFTGSIASSHIEGGPADIIIPIPVGITIELSLKRSHFTGTLTNPATGPRMLEDSSLCGVVPVLSLAHVPDLIASFTGTSTPPCDEGAPANLAELLLGGATPLGVRIGPAQPDVDLDGDGLESYEVLSDGEDGCQPVVSVCIDGDGTRIPGRNCAFDPRMADGYSSAVTLDGVEVSINGTM